jgi:hypothetical protein
MLHGVGATSFEPVISRTRSKRSFLNYGTLVEERGAAWCRNAQTTRIGPYFEAKRGKGQMGQRTPIAGAKKDTHRGKARCC